MGIHTEEAEGIHWKVSEAGGIHSEEMGSHWKMMVRGTGRERVCSIH